MIPRIETNSIDVSVGQQEAGHGTRLTLDDYRRS
ncbi:hypothetical protein RB213_003430, partial [Colletotrichum asianum]